MLNLKINTIYINKTRRMYHNCTNNRAALYRVPINFLFLRLLHRVVSPLAPFPGPGVEGGPLPVPAARPLARPAAEAQALASRGSLPRPAAEARHPRAASLAPEPRLLSLLSLLSREVASNRVCLRPQQLSGDNIVS